MPEILIEKAGPLSDFSLAEHKGTGHPDSICDALAEEVSRALCRYYLKEFGTILHHNTDKILLVGGSAKSDFLGGRIEHPMEIILAGRATDRFRGKAIPVHEIAIVACREWLQRNLRYVNLDTDVVIQSRIRSGSGDLTELFSRNQSGIPLAIDTSFGVG